MVEVFIVWVVLLERNNVRDTGSQVVCIAVYSVIILANRMVHVLLCVYITYIHYSHFLKLATV